MFISFIPSFPLHVVLLCAFCCTCVSTVVGKDNVCIM
jgi:hypothetical protein